MNKTGVLELIDAEIEQLTHARKILSGSDGLGPRRGTSKVRSFGSRKRRHMSAEARRRISEAQKKRWSAVKRAAKKAA
jgi:hypothetical protein